MKIPTLAQMAKALKDCGYNSEEVAKDVHKKVNDDKV